MDAEWAMTGLIIVPLTAAIVVYVTATRFVAAWGAAVAMIQTGLTFWLTRSILQSGSVQVSLGGWEAPLGIPLYADGISALMLIMTTLVGATSTCYAAAYFSALQHDPRRPSSQPSIQTFWPLWLILWSALNALFLSADVFNLYVTLELITISAVALIGLAGKAQALVAAIRYLFAALMGSLFYLLGVALLYSTYGTVSWHLLAETVQPDVLTWCAASLMIIGLLLKTALFPLHFWLPAAHANAPAPVSGLLSGLVLKASFFMILRLWFYVFYPVMPVSAGWMLSVLGSAAILWGSIQAIRQQRVKLMIAYSTVAQVGYLFLVFGLACEPVGMLAWRGAAYLAFAHASAKAAAFMVAGSLMYMVGSDHLDRWEGIGRREPQLIFTLALAGVSLIGLPPSAGFIAKWLLLNAAISNGRWEVAVVIVLGGLLAAVYVFRIIGVSLSSAVPMPEVAPVPRMMRWAPLVLAMAVIVGGLVTTEPIRLLEIGAPPIAAREVAP